MNITAYKFPKLTKADIAFSTVRTDPVLLEEAKRRGFYNGHTPFNELFSDLFYKGGQLNFKNDLDPEFKNTAATYLRALMMSFEPSHEDKEAVSAMLLSELCNVNVPAGKK